MSTTDPDFDAILADLYQKPRRVAADGQVVESHDPDKLAAAVNRLKANKVRCLTGGMVQKIRSGPAYGA